MNNRTDEVPARERTNWKTQSPELAQDIVYRLRQGEIVEFPNHYELVEVSGVSSTMRAAAVILARSHIDDSLNRLLRVCVAHDPAPWREEVIDASKTRYTLRDLDGLP